MKSRRNQLIIVAKRAKWRAWPLFYRCAADGSTRGQAKRNKRDALLMPLVVRAISEMSAKRRAPPVDTVAPRSLVVTHWLLCLCGNGRDRPANEFVSRGNRILQRLLGRDCLAAEIGLIHSPAVSPRRLLFSSWLIPLVEYLVNLIKNLGDSWSKKNRLTPSCTPPVILPRFLFPRRRRHASLLTSAPSFLSFARPWNRENLQFSRFKGIPAVSHRDFEGEDFCQFSLIVVEYNRNGVDCFFLFFLVW